MGWFKKFSNSLHEMVREGFNADDQNMIADAVQNPEKYKGINSDQISGVVVPDKMPLPKSKGLGL